MIIKVKIQIIIWIGRSTRWQEKTNNHEIKIQNVNKVARKRQITIKIENIENLKKYDFKK